jgi:hypothetical protein
VPGFLKAYREAATAGEARRRARALRAQGVATPAARCGPAPTEVVFDKIAGRTGRDLVGTGDDLEAVLAAIGGLHRAALVDLPVFDPLLRIRPRLELTEVPTLRAIAAEPVPQGSATLHGDLHVGQAIRDGSGMVWIIDLDDLAIGPPEADLANFAAHLATSLPQGGIADWAERVRRMWTGQGHHLDGQVFEQFLRFALLRRHLKLRAAARPDFEAEILAYLRGSASFSIR